jgi:hypothetical protein
VQREAHGEEVPPGGGAGAGGAGRGPWGRRAAGRQRAQVSLSPHCIMGGRRHAYPRTASWEVRVSLSQAIHMSFMIYIFDLIIILSYIKTTQ